MGFTRLGIPIRSVTPLTSSLAITSQAQTPGHDERSVCVANDNLRGTPTHKHKEHSAFGEAGSTVLHSALISHTAPSYRSFNSGATPRDSAFSCVNEYCPPAEVIEYEKANRDGWRFVQAPINGRCGGGTNRRRARSWYLHQQTRPPPT